MQLKLSAPPDWSERPLESEEQMRLDRQSPGDFNWSDDEGGDDSSAQMTSAGGRLVVRNTFYTVVSQEEEEDAKRVMTRSYSDGELTQNSNNTPRSSQRNRLNAPLDLEKSKSNRSERSSMHSASARSTGTSAISDVESYSGPRQDSTFETLASSMASDESVSRPDAAKDAPQATTSLGNALHDSGQCKPCVYFSSEMGCHKGANCRFCHAAHRRKGRQRPCKSTRNQCKKVVDLLDTVEDAALHEASMQLAAQSNYMRQLLKARQGSDPIAPGATGGATGGSSSSKISL